jgi:hypothetical protein
VGVKSNGEDVVRRQVKNINPIATKPAANNGGFVLLSNSYYL